MKYRRVNACGTYHDANEKALYVLEGTGVVRLPDGEYPIGKGDYLAFPRGPEGAHVVTAWSRSVVATAGGLHHD